MKQVCLLCERTSPDSNLYCQETYCPAEMSPNILGYGEWLGDIEIVKAVTVLRSSVLYEATHQKEKVFLKVAHPGVENTNRLKREAEFLRQIQLSRKPNPYLPELLPPYVGTTIKDDPLGKTMLKEHLLYFYMFKHVAAEPLRDILTKHPQLWINHIGWTIISTAYAVAALHAEGLLHCALCPEAVLVRFDEKLNVPRVILHDFGAVSSREEFAQNWYPFIVPPAYTAPEVVNMRALQPGYATDVYGLGLIMYEMLVGQPTFTYKLNSDMDVYRAVMRNQRIKMNREDAISVANIALQAVDPQMARRPADAATLASQLMSAEVFGKVPLEKKSRRPSLNTILVMVGALLAVAFLIALAVSLNNFMV